jgi:hypothetical protein
LKPRPEAYQLYGKLLEQLGERERAADAFRSGLALATAQRADRDPTALPATIPVLPAPGT